MQEKLAKNGDALRLVLLDSIPKWGGGEKWCVEAARALGARGHHVVVACGKGSPLEMRAQEAGVATWAAPLLGGRGFFSAFKLGSFCKRERIEAIIGNVGRDLWMGAIACRRSGARLLQRRGLVRPVKSGLLSRWLYTRAVQRVLVNSLAIRECMVSSVDFLDPSRFVLIPNGIDTRSTARGDGRRARVKLELGQEALVAGTIGRLAAMKGHADLFQAWARVREHARDPVLLVIGEGEEEGALRALARELKIDDSVRFLGFRRDVPDVIDALDLLVLPSVRDEGCSNALLEAMWHAKPAVVTDCGGLPAVITHGELGLVVPIGDVDAMARALARLLSSREERQRMGEAARSMVEQHYTLEAAMDTLVSLLFSLRG